LTDVNTIISEIKVGYSDLVYSCKIYTTQRIKGTPGITGL